MDELLTALSGYGSIEGIPAAARTGSGLVKLPGLTPAPGGTGRGPRKTPAPGAVLAPRPSRTDEARKEELRREDEQLRKGETASLEVAMTTPSGILPQSPLPPQGDRAGSGFRPIPPPEVVAAFDGGIVYDAPPVHLTNRRKSALWLWVGGGAAMLGIGIVVATSFLSGRTEIATPTPPPKGEPVVEVAKPAPSTPSKTEPVPAKAVEPVAVAARVKVTLQSKPVGVSVYELRSDGSRPKVGMTPFALEVERNSGNRTYQFELTGYNTEVRVVPTNDDTVVASVQLVKADKKVIRVGGSAPASAPPPSATERLKQIADNERPSERPKVVEPPPKPPVRETKPKKPKMDEQPTFLGGE
jgi:hypothetical protein